MPDAAGELLPLDVDPWDETPVTVPRGRMADRQPTTAAYRVVSVPSKVVEFDRRHVVVDAARLQETLNELDADYEIVAAGIGDGEAIILRRRGAK